jgi:protein polybromo-1
LQLYPDYYLIVTQPIDLKMIAMKIHQNQYPTLDDMETDLLLMIANAKKYNDPKSQIYKVEHRTANLAALTFLLFRMRLP